MKCECIPPERGKLQTREVIICQNGHVIKFTRCTKCGFLPTGMIKVLSTCKVPPPYEPTVIPDDDEVTDKSQVLTVRHDYLKLGEKI